MSACHQHFADFLANHVNLNPSRISDLRSHVSAVSDYLTGHADLAEKVTADVIPQGSYAHRTIIKPATGNDYDADVLLPMTEVEDWEPRHYTEKVHTALTSSSRYAEKLELRKRCVRVQYAGGFHIDVVPFVARDQGHTSITHRTRNKWFDQDPPQFTAWLEQKNRDANRHLVPVVRLMKYVRDRSSAQIPSVVLTALLADRVHTFSTNSYKSVPHALVTLVEDLHAYLASLASPPFVNDQTEQDLADRWTQSGFENFQSQLATWSARLREALDAPYQESIEKWRAVFGDAFGATTTREASSPEVDHLLRQASTPQAPGEQFLRKDFGIPVQIDAKYRLRLEGTMTSRRRFGRPRSLPSAGDLVPIGQSLKFHVQECTVDPPYDLYWKVRNHGEEARQRNMERGQIHRGNHQLIETSSFAGGHWVEVWAVKNGIAVAYDRQDVTITPRPPR